MTTDHLYLTSGNTSRDCVYSNENSLKSCNQLVSLLESWGLNVEVFKHLFAEDIIAGRKRKEQKGSAAFFRRMDYSRYFGVRGGYGNGSNCRSVDLYAVQIPILNG